MKTKIKGLFIWLGLSVLMMILWILGLSIGNMVFPSTLMEASSDTGNNNQFLFLVVCGLNTWIIMYFINNSRYRGFTLAGIVFIVAFGIQYFMSQIETLWFNDSLILPINGIWTIVSGGAFMILIFSLSATWLTGKFGVSNKPQVKQDIIHLKPMMIRVILLSVVIWPLIYFLAGYLIAWQFADVRLFYSETTEMDSFYTIMEANFNSGLYFFQIIRGVLWVLIATMVLYTTHGSWIHKGLILGLLFAILGSSGLILPNPYMPFMVRMAHLVETAPSSFIWGMVIAWFMLKFMVKEHSDTIIHNPII